MLFPSNTTETPKEITEADVVAFIEAHGRRIRADFPESFSVLTLEHKLYSDGGARTVWHTYCAETPINHSGDCDTLDAAMAHLFSKRSEAIANKIQELRANAKLMLAEANKLETANNKTNV